MYSLRVSHVTEMPNTERMIIIIIMIRRRRRRRRRRIIIIIIIIIIRIIIIIIIIIKTLFSEDIYIYIFFISLSFTNDFFEQSNTNMG